MRNSSKFIAITCIAAFMMPAPAAAADVTLSALLINSCVLSIGSSGVMTASSDGQILGSEQSGGSAATLGVVVIGILPTITFATPTLTTSPAGWSASPTIAVRYTSTGGANQAYTSSSSSATLTSLIDTFTVHGRVNSSTGFAAGNYTLRTVATCQQ